MRHSAAIFTAIILTVTSVYADGLILSCNEDNDLYKSLSSASIQCSRYDSPAEAINSAAVDSSILILADGYPQTQTQISDALYSTAHQKNLKLFIEFPDNVHGLEISGTASTHLERGVVTADIFGPTLSINDLFIIHDCKYVKIDAPNPYLVLAKVAGFDTAIFGLDNTAGHPVLFKHPSDSNIMISTTKLSQFVTGRYVPKHGWKAIWKMILNWADPTGDYNRLDWDQTVKPSYRKNEPLPQNAQQQAIEKSITWHKTAKMLVHPSWENQLDKFRNPNVVGPAPNPDLPTGDGSKGLLEGVNSNISSLDGSQHVRWWRRTDVNGESTLPFALHSLLSPASNSATIGANLADWVYFDSGYFYNNDPANGHYGLIGWGKAAEFAFYQDNDIKAILGTIGTAGALKSNKWDQVLVKNILGNYRTTGQAGYRSNRLDDPAVNNNGWQYYWRRYFTNYHPHYEAWMWSAYLWLYDKTGYEPLLERTRRAITSMMNAYPNSWRWTNGFQQERGRMLLPLSWLIRVDDTEQHRQWLKQIASDMMEDQVACGAIREELGRPGMGDYAPPSSNAAYGTSEASLIQKNGDPLADMLYTCNFTFLGLHEAYAATGDSQYKQMADSLAEFFIRIQVSSEAHPELAGAWYRAFDYELWDFWGSNADSGWGAWSVECGWTQGWLTSVLAMRELNTSLWDISNDSKIGEVFEPIRKQMLPDDQIELPKPKIISHAAIGKTVQLKTPADSRYPGLEASGLVDGAIYECGFSDWPWMGWEGKDLEATIDLGKLIVISKIAAHFMQETRVGIYMPREVIFSISLDGENFIQLSKVLSDTPSSAAGPVDKNVELIVSDTPRTLG